MNNELELDASYNLAGKTYKVGGKYEGEVASKQATLKAHFSDKDNKVDGEASLSIDGNNKATVNFSNIDVTSAKYAFTNNGITYEPSYCLSSAAPSLAVSKTVSSIFGTPFPCPPLVFPVNGLVYTRDAWLFGVRPCGQRLTLDFLSGRPDGAAPPSSGIICNLS